jgi:hypothetical protein
MMVLSLSLLPWVAFATQPVDEPVEKSVATQEEIDAVLLIPMMQNGISFIGGGVGVEERQALAQWAKSYSLRIEMALKSGEYLGDLQIKVFDNTGKRVLESLSDGPLMYLQLPSGHYKVEISDPGSTGLATKVREVSVSEGRQTRLFFAWP